MKQIVSVVAPAYNEELVVDAFYKRITSVCEQLENYDYEILVVNDGSKDKTPQMIKEYVEQDPAHRSFVNLSRNYGHEVAVAAGMDHAIGDVVVLMDFDLQDTPELIGDMLKKYEEGFDIVNAKRATRDGETWMKKFTAKMFYKVFSASSGKVRMPENVGNYRLVSRRAVEAFKELRETHRFARGLFCWVGFPTTEIEFQREARVAGETKYNYKTMINYAIEGLTSFTIKPLRWATYTGMVTAFLSAIYAISILIRALSHDVTLQTGWASMMIVMLFFGSVQLIFLGIIGEYLGRVFNETKNRPLYFAQEYIPVRKSKTTED